MAEDLERIEPGDSAARAAEPSCYSIDWEQVVALHRRRVLVSILAMGLPLDQAEDLVQQTFVRLMEQDAAGRLLDARFPQLAMAQARFYALNQLKRGQSARRRLSASEVEGLTVVDGAADPERQTQARERLHLATQLLRRLPPSAWKVFRLMYEDPPPPQQEIADAVGLSLQRVRQIVCEVRKKLDQLLGGPP